MKRLLVVMMLLLLVAGLTVGCKDVTDSFKPGNFGSSAQEKEMVAALTTKHGDLRESGAPRILETMMTTKVENGMPADQVSKYNKGSKELYVWFVYDNFNENQLQVEWIYTTEDYSIHTFTAQTGKDFGRGTFILKQPDAGWPVGKYKVEIRGAGVSSSVTFEIIEGQTVSVPILLPGGKVALPVKEPGWYLTGWEYMIASIDVTLQPNGYHSAVSGLYNYAQGTGEKGDFTISHWRNDSNGRRVAGSTSYSKWGDPPEYLKEGAVITLNIDRSYDANNTWGQNGFSIKFDSEDLPGAGYATAGRISFVNSAGTNTFHTFSGPVSNEKGFPKGKAGDKKAIWVYLEGHSYKYTYEWQD